MIRSHWISLLIVSYCSVANGAALHAWVDLVELGVTTFNSDLTPGPAVDVYHVMVCNPNAIDATSLNLSFISPGQFVNNNPGALINPGGLTFSNSTDLPSIATFTFGETFFVVPPGQILSVDDVDTNSELSSDYTVAGTTALVPANGTAVVAVISVPAGVYFLGDGFVGQAAVAGLFEKIVFPSYRPCIPEPSTAVLCGLALTVFVSRRR